MHLKAWAKEGNLCATLSVVPPNNKQSSVAIGRYGPVTGRVRCDPLRRALSAARSKSPDNPFEENDPPEPLAPGSIVASCLDSSGPVQSL